MSEPLKKPSSAPDQAAAKEGTEDGAKGVKISLEKTMLLNLQKLKEAGPSIMNAEDLEYPVVPPTSQSPSLEFDDDLPSVPEGAAPEGTRTEVSQARIDDDLPDMEALALDDDIDISDVTNAIAPSAPEEDDPLSNGFELDDEDTLLSSQDNSSSSESESEESQEQEVGEMTTKRDLVRLKRKLALEEKKRQREQEAIKEAEELRKRQEYEKQNNILSIAELKRKADEQKTNTGMAVGSYEDMFGTSNQTKITIAPPSNRSALMAMPSTKSTSGPTLTLAPAKTETSKPNSGTSHGVPQSTASFVDHAGPSGGAFQGGIPVTPYTLGPPRKWYESLGVSVGSIFAEVLKVATPALIVGYFLLQQQDTHISQKAINHILSGNQFEMELGLSMLKKHFTPENNLHYYDLVKMKVEKDLEEVWTVVEFQESLRADKLTEFANYSFVDGTLNLPLLVKGKMEMHQKKVLETYARFYETEMKDNNSKKYTDHLQQANIFLTTGECLKSYDQFGVVQGVMADSYASLYGKVLAFNCAIMKSPEKAKSHFKEQTARVALAKIRQRIQEMNKIVGEENKKTSYEQPNRYPSSSSKVKKSYR